jgi:hypothetical protein
VLEIAVAIAARAAGTSSATVHSAPCPTSYRCLLARMIGAGPSATAGGFGQISKPSFNIGLMCGIAVHL